MDLEILKTMSNEELASHQVNLRTTPSEILITMEFDRRKTEAQLKQQHDYNLQLLEKQLASAKRLAYTSGAFGILGTIIGVLLTFWLKK